MIFIDVDADRAYERGVQGVHRYPGSEELRLSRAVLDQNFFHPCPFCVPDYGTGPNLSEDLFFVCSSPDFGEKMGPNLSDLFLIHFFDSFVCTLPNFGGQASIFVLPGKISL